MLKKGDEYRAMNNLSDEHCLRPESIKLSLDKTMKMTLNDEKILRNGDRGQGEGLNNKKFVFNNRK